MEIIESTAWIAGGFVPTIVALEALIGSGKIIRSGKGKEVGSAKMEGSVSA